MATVSHEHISEHPELSPTTQRKAARWSYFFYCEVLKIFRDPPNVFFGVVFATAMFLIFGLSFPGSLSTTMASMATYGAFLASFQVFSTLLAQERSLGWNKLLRTTSMSSSLYLGSKLLVILLTGTISMLLLFAVAGFSGVHLDLAVWAELLGAMVLGMLALSLMGLFLGFLGSANLALTLSLSLLILMSFASGLYVPMQWMPAFIQQIAPYLPTYNLAQLAWTIVGSPSGDGQVWTHVLILLAYTAGFAVLAGWAYMRDKNKNFA